MGRIMFRGIRVVLAFFICLSALGSFSQQMALADTADGGLVARSPVLGFRELGANSTVAFYGAQGTETLTIPVPRGLVPAELLAVVEIPVNLRAGVLTVTQDDRTISRVPLPEGDRVPISIPLAGVTVVDNAVTVVLRTFLVPLEGYCLDPTNPLRLSDSAIRYEGVEMAPATVSDFLPPVLRKLTILIPSAPSNVESGAAIRLATAVVARYGKQSPEITLARLGEGLVEPAGPSAPMERQIVIREGADAGVALRGTGGVPWLLIGGQADQLTNQTRLLASDVSRLALASKAVVGPLKTVAQLPADLTTMRQLGQPGVNATALDPQVSIALDQTRLGRSVRDVRVHLRGDYTVLPQSVGGSVVVAIAGTTIDQWPTDGSGTIDRWIDVPNALLQRYTNLGVAIDISGNTGRCGEFQPITLTIDGDSPIQSSAADPPVLEGFQSLPQALMPRVEIGIGSDAFADTSRAMSILVGLQGLSALPIDTVVLPFAQAVASPNPAVLIAAEGWSNQDLTLPVAVDGTGQLSVQSVDGTGESGTLALDPALEFGSLQTVRDGQRTLLVATSNGGSGQLDALLGWLGGDVNRWSRLAGTAVIGTPLQDPVMVNSTLPQSESSPTATSSSTPWIIGAGVIVAVAIGAGSILLRRRRRTPGA